MGREQAPGPGGSDLEEDSRCGWGEARLVLVFETGSGYVVQPDLELPMEPRLPGAQELVPVLGSQVCIASPTWGWVCSWREQFLRCG